MDFNNLLGTLARSSAQAVSTLAKASDEIEVFKEYLYVETEIEKKFVAALEAATNSNQIIFLCGSSGDGKSEILRRHYGRNKERFDFHLDATHSFKPDQNAIEALDDLFERHEASPNPLVVGINIGMLCNYQNAGSDRHAEIKQAIASFIKGGREFDRFLFLSFEDYPKFCLQAGGVGSDFVSQLLEKITAASQKNPLYRAFLKDVEYGEKLLHHNYRLLQEPAVKECIVKILLHARVKFDQFLSARALLDFIHNLVCGSSVLFDNLFTLRTSDLAGMLHGFDPCLLRSKSIDEFLIQQSLEVKDEEFETFKSAYEKRFGRQDLSPSAWLRAFYILQNTDIGNNYHDRFKQSFEQALFSDYIEIWQLHNEQSPNPHQIKQLRNFYSELLIAGLLKFANRLMPSLPREEVYLCERNSVALSARARVSLDTKRIYSAGNSGIQCFNAAIKVDDEPIKVFPVSVSFLELVRKINNGYRPNRHDKNTIVILEEVVEEIVRIAKRSRTIYFYKGGFELSLMHEDGELVAGDER